MKKISDEELLKELKRMNDEKGDVILQKEFNKYNAKYSINAYKRAFGGLAPALILLGKRSKYMRGYSRDDAISEVKRLYKELKHIPTTIEFNELSIMSYFTLNKLINPTPWYIFLEECGISKDEIDKFVTKRNISTEELHDEIIRLKTLFGGRYPTYYDMHREGIFTPNTYEAHFGSWLKAMKVLGFDDYVPQSVFHNQRHVMGQDGIIYRSAFEASIGDKLFVYFKEGKIGSYEYEKKVCSTKTWTCDFYIKLNNGTDLWLEADGMMDVRKDPYDDNNEKIKYYKSNNCNYIIFPYRKNINDELDKVLF